MTDQLIPDRFRAYTGSTGPDHIIKSITWSTKREAPLLAGILRAAEVGVDIGSGNGDSTYALSELCPNLSTIHAVDPRFEITSEYRQKIKTALKQHLLTLKAFVAQGIKADVMMMASLPDYGSFAGEDFARLADCLNPGGVLIEVAPDFPLEKTELLKYFEPLLLKDGLRIYRKR